MQKIHKRDPTSQKTSKYSLKKEDMNLIKYKKIVEEYTPKILSRFVIYLWRKSYVQINEFQRRVRLKKFTESCFKKIQPWNTLEFYLKINPKNGFVDQTIFIDGVYEKNIYQLMHQIIKPGFTCVDIGANIWMYTNYIPKLVGDTGKVIAFEPIKSIYKQNKESIERNKYRNVEIYNLALSDRKWEIHIFIDDNNLGGSSIYKNSHHQRTEKIQTDIWDILLKKEWKIDFIKIDTEWFELSVLQWLSSTLSTFRPDLIIEYSPILFKNPEDAWEVLSILKSYYQRVYIIEYEQTLDLKSYKDSQKYFQLKNLEQINLLFSNTL